MNKINRLVYPVIVLLSLAAAFSAHAESPSRDHGVTQVWTSTKTRAQVQAELFQARADGTTQVYAESYNPPMVAKSSLTREEVRAQARVELATSPAAQMVGEDSGSFYLSQRPAAAEASRMLAKVAR